MIESRELSGCILSTENGLRMMDRASRSMSSRVRGGTRWLRWTLNPERVHPRSIRAHSGGRSPFFTRNVMVPYAEKFPPHLHALAADGLMVDSGFFHVMPDVSLAPLVEVEVFAEAVDGHNDAGRALG